MRGVVGAFTFPSGLPGSFFTTALPLTAAMLSTVTTPPTAPRLALTLAFEGSEYFADRAKRRREGVDHGTQVVWSSVRRAFAGLWRRWLRLGLSLRLGLGLRFGSGGGGFFVSCIGAGVVALAFTFTTFSFTFAFAALSTARFLRDGFGSCVNCFGVTAARGECLPIEFHLLGHDRELFEKLEMPLMAFGADESASELLLAGKEFAHHLCMMHLFDLGEGNKVLPLIGRWLPAGGNRSFEQGFVRSEERLESLGLAALHLLEFLNRATILGRRQKAMLLVEIPNNLGNRRFAELSRIEIRHDRLRFRSEGGKKLRSHH